MVKGLVALERLPRASDGVAGGLPDDADRQPGRHAGTVLAWHAHGDLTDAQLNAALARGRKTLQDAPRGAAACHDRQTKRVIVELTNGCTFAFPPRLAQGLEEARDDQLAQVEVLGSGSGLHWEALDADLSIPGLLAGRATSPAKAAAARANGSKGGRPRRVAGAGSS